MLSFLGKKVYLRTKYKSNMYFVKEGALWTFSRNIAQVDTYNWHESYFFTLCDILSNLDIANKSVRTLLFTTYIEKLTISNVICLLVNISKSSKWELGLVHYITKFTISRFVISRFECLCKSKLYKQFPPWHLERKCSC